MNMPLQIRDKTRAMATQAEADLKEQFTLVDTISQANAEKVLDAFQTYRVAESDFAGTTGYGYDDMGRDKLERFTPISSVQRMPLSGSRW